MVPLKEVQAAIGYIRGGVTALACKKDYLGRSRGDQGEASENAEV
jgi:hypothetical protein